MEAFLLFIIISIICGQLFKLVFFNTETCCNKQKNETCLNPDKGGVDQSVADNGNAYRNNECRNWAVLFIESALLLTSKQRTEILHNGGRNKYHTHYSVAQEGIEENIVCQRGVVEILGFVQCVIEEFKGVKASAEQGIVFAMLNGKPPHGFAVTECVRNLIKSGYQLRQYGYCNSGNCNCTQKDEKQTVPAGE